MKTLTLHGVPYSVDDAGNVFAYGSTLGKPVRLGSYNSGTKMLDLDTSWASSDEANAFLAAYRLSLRQATGVALEKAKQQQQSV
jgi:hypothetical protein